MRDATKRLSLQAWLVAAFIAVGTLASLAVALVVFPLLEANIRRDQARVAAAELSRTLQTTRDFESGYAAVGVGTLATTLEGDARLTPLPDGSGAPVPLHSSMKRGYLARDRFSQAGQWVVDGNTPPQRVIIRKAADGAEIAEGAILASVDDQLDYVLEAAVPVRGTAQRVAFVRRRIYLAVALVLGLASLVGTAIARILGARIRRVAGTAATLARGDLSARADEVGPAELTSLGESLNTMASRLEGLVAETVSDRDRAQALVASLQEGVIAVSESGEVAVANDAARQFLRIPKGAETLTLSQLPESVRTTVAEALAAPGSEDTVEATLPSGTEVLISISPPVGGAGVVVTLRDVTEERRLSRARRDLIANVSHELKTPLTAVKGFLELMEDERMSPERRNEFLGLMTLEVARLERLVAEQLELARLDAGALTLERTPVDLGEIAAEITQSRRVLAEREEVELVAARGAVEVVVEADAARVEQILLILLDNAIRHTPAGGKVTVGVSRDEQFGAISVRDTGAGIPLDAQQFIFDRFFQADRSREGSGLGLGLAIARGLAEAHGGSIQMRSAPNVGSVFTVHLPLAPASVASLSR